MTVDTTLAAYESVKPKAPALREQVIALVKANPNGISRTQIAAQLDINEITSGSRITELLQSGVIKRKGETVLSTSGKSEHLYIESDGVPLPKKTKPYTISAIRMVDILKTFGVTADAVMNTPGFIWNEQPEGSDFWIAVNNALEA